MPDLTLWISRSVESGRSARLVPVLGIRLGHRADKPRLSMASWFNLFNPIRSTGMEATH